MKDTRMLRFALLGAALLSPAAAWAQTATAPSTTTIDLTNIVNVLLSLAAAAVTAAIGVLVPYTLKRLGIANNADLAAKLNDAGVAAAGAAYNYALAHEGGLSNVDVHSAAIAAGVAHLTIYEAPTLAALNITPENTADIVRSRLGVLLAGDGTVTASAPKQLPAVKLLDPVPPPAAAPVPAAAAPAAPPAP